MTLKLAGKLNFGWHRSVLQIKQGATRDNVFKKMQIPRVIHCMEPGSIPSETEPTEIMEV